MYASISTLVIFYFVLNAQDFIWDKTYAYIALQRTVILSISIIDFLAMHVTLIQLMLFQEIKPELDTGHN